MTLEELLKLVAEHWDARYQRGRLLHIHRNDLKTEDGSTVHLRVMVQTVSEPGDESTR